MRRLRLFGTSLLALALLLATAGLVAAQQQQQVTVQINPVGGSGVNGTATLTAQDGQTLVQVSASGLSPGEHANHIHAGSCANLGGIQINLTNLQADAQGNASATTTVNRTLGSISGAIAIHAGTLDVAPQIVACGDIPSVAAAPAATPGATPAAAPGAAPGVAPAAQPAVAGGPAPLLAAGVLGLLGLLTLGGGLFLRRR